MLKSFLNLIKLFEEYQAKENNIFCMDKYSYFIYLFNQFVKRYIYIDLMISNLKININHKNIKFSKSNLFRIIYSNITHS